MHKKTFGVLYAQQNIFKDMHFNTLYYRISEAKPKEYRARNL